VAQSAKLTATEIRDKVASGALKATDVARACIEAIKSEDAEIGAWVWSDPDHMMRRAVELDDWRESGKSLGPLHGVPVGIKDVIDTAHIPTQNGSPLDAGRVPERDAFVVAKLVQAGALIAGKTVTTELAFLDPSPTRNPVNLAHTPGGSSAGSAAAVAAGMVPFAIGTQTGGSVIRPSAFCGVVGYKPTFGLISRTGILKQAPTLDTVGVMAATVEDAALLAEVLQGYDPNDPATAPIPFQHLADVARTKPPATPMLAFVKQPAWDEADADTQQAFAELTGFLGGNCIEIDLPQIFTDAVAARDQVHIAELTASYARYGEQAGTKLGARLKEAMKLGKKIPAPDYVAARGMPDALNAFLDQIFDQFDAIITPAAAGAAPEGFKTTGSAAFNGLWTFCGTPAVTVPVLKAANGLPMGVQLVGRKGDDGRLLRTARWLHGQVASAEG